jgi:hypothetical protein
VHRCRLKTAQCRHYFVMPRGAKYDSSQNLAATMPLLPTPSMLISFACLLASTLISRGTASSVGSSESSFSGAIVDVGYVRYLGNRSYPNTVAYLGVPYAEPPLGDRRFRAPLPLNTTRLNQESEGKG